MLTVFLMKTLREIYARMGIMKVLSGRLCYILDRRQDNIKKNAVEVKKYMFFPKMAHSCLLISGFEN